MHPSPELTPVPAVPSRTSLPPWRRTSPLAREIAVVLVVKALVLALLWFAFFRTPAAPGMAMDPQRVERKVLAPAGHPEPPHAIR